MTTAKFFDSHLHPADRFIRRALEWWCIQHDPNIESHRQFLRVAMDYLGGGQASKGRDAISSEKYNRMLFYMRRTHGSWVQCCDEAVATAPKKLIAQWRAESGFTGDDPITPGQRTFEELERPTRTRYYGPDRVPQKLQYCAAEVQARGPHGPYQCTKRRKQDGILCGQHQLMQDEGRYVRIPEQE